LTQPRGACRRLIQAGAIILLALGIGCPSRGTTTRKPLRNADRRLDVILTAR
jgi:hypothetical protein